VDQADDVCEADNANPVSIFDQCNLMSDEDDYDELSPKNATDVSLNNSEIDIADWHEMAVNEIPGDVVEMIIENYPVPGPGYKFEASCMGNSSKTKKQRFRYFNRELLSKEKHGRWLIYSKKRKGLFCKFCAIFEKLRKKERKPAQTDGWRLIDRPLASFNKINEVLKRHADAGYHTDSVSAADQWLR
jgi:hypothetical protein